MARPIGGRLSEAFRQTYSDAGLTQLDVEAGLHQRGFTNVDQPLVSKWARGMRQIPLEVLPALDDICGKPKGHLLRLSGYVDDQDGSVESAVRADPRLDATGRMVVLETYEHQVGRTVERSRSAIPAI